MPFFIDSGINQSFRCQVGCGCTNFCHTVLILMIGNCRDTYYVLIKNSSLNLLIFRKKDAAGLINPITGDGVTHGIVNSHSNSSIRIHLRGGSNFCGHENNF